MEGTQAMQEKSITERLRADILAGRYHPGQWLKQADLEQSYGANRFEVRMALSDLCARQLIDHTPNRGYRIINPTDQEREQLFQIRTILETAAARILVPKATKEEIDELAGLAEEFEDSIENRSRAELRQINFRFHERFYGLADNQLLSNLIRELRERGTPGRREGWNTLAAIRASARDHREMVQHLKARDATRVCETIHRHLYRWREFALVVPE